MKYDYEDVIVAVKKRRWVSLKGIVAWFVETKQRNMIMKRLR
jgi:hypothetical protein